MEDQLLWMLIVQLIVIFFVAICLLMFMVKKLVGRNIVPSNGSKSIIITAAETRIGSQIAIRLAELGFRVFAGVSDINSKATQKLRSSGSPWLHILQLDVTNDESLHSGVKAVGEHLHAGEKGLWAVIHLAGTGLLVSSGQEQGCDDEQQLRTALEVTVVGMLRLATICLPHLSPTKGRLIILGADDGMSLGLRAWENGKVGISHGVWTAARFAAEGLAAGLRAQLRPHQIPVISLHPDAYYAQRIMDIQSLPTSEKISSQKFTSWNPTEPTSRENMRDLTITEPLTDVLSSYAMNTIEEAILSTNPEPTYVLTPSASSRIKSMLVAFSPQLVTSTIGKSNKSTGNYEHLV